jgi:30S ribosomal protein S31
LRPPEPPKALACYNARFAASPRSTTTSQFKEDFDMGKGDRKTAKGKRYNSSYGNARPQAAKASGAPAGAAAVKKTAKPAVKAAPAKKAVAKKVAAKD